MNEVRAEDGWWDQDQAMIRGSLRYNIDGMQEITKVLDYMELQHFHIYEYPILKDTIYYPMYSMRLEEAQFPDIISLNHTFKRYEGIR